VRRAVLLHLVALFTYGNLCLRNGPAGGSERVPEAFSGGPARARSGKAIASKICATAKGRHFDKFREDPLTSTLRRR